MAMTMWDLFHPYIQVLMYSVILTYCAECKMGVKRSSSSYSAMIFASKRLCSRFLYVQERAFLGVATLKELILRRPHGPEGTGTFLQALLEITLSNFELVSCLHFCHTSVGISEVLFNRQECRLFM